VVIKPTIGGNDRDGGPSESERESLRGALANVLSNASTLPERVQSRLLGQDMGPLRTKIADAIRPLIAREREEARAEVLEVAASNITHNQSSESIRKMLEMAAAAIRARAETGAPHE